MEFKPTVANRNLWSWFGSTGVWFVSPHQGPQVFHPGGTGHSTKFRTRTVRGGGGGGGGRGNKKIFVRGRFVPPPPPPMSSPNIFIHTFRIPFYWQMVTLSHTTAVNLLSFKYELVTKPWSFLVYFHSYKMRLLALLGPLTERNGRFLDLFIHFSQWNPCPLIYLKPEKVPLSSGAFPYRPS